ncbi:uncharacterized protein BDZ99DRAFT_394629 [Mytilinidion resinicola]|uniref:Porphobilinogen deaminase n=1 Tax=Mytilinidion resinicola TaxID=574789 RepID=A0A6A6YCH7_9PEZI|nr:uncharacterized protein BDZ99DRAFT_394629 [Mytilinidion resinicola]KAF2806536.1 hypothetical protein BDZ99DRAFT_394629 [Mytilinidion resinicola]
MAQNTALLETISVSPPSSVATNLPTIKIGTRRSALAQIQARAVEKQLKDAFPDRTYAIHAVLAQGDKDKVTPLQQLSQGENAKSLWTGELEAMLEQGDLDMIVHCLKDMPTQLPPTLTLGCICPREDPRDVLCVSPKLASTCKDLASLPEDSVIGTSSVRRAAQLRRLYPGLKFADLRGNVPTRLAKLDSEDSQFGGIILAAAGLIRLGLQARITQYLSKDSGGMLHAVGQGTLAIEVRSNDTAMKELLAKVGSERNARASLAQRALLRALEGGCSVPIGVETEWKSPKKGVATGIEPAREYGQDGKALEEEQDDDEVGDDEELLLRAIVVSVDGKDFVETEMLRKVASVAEAETFGQDIAKILVAKGADKILEKISKDKQWDAKKRLEAEASK